MHANRARISGRAPIRPGVIPWRKLRLGLAILPLAIAIPVPNDSSYTHVRAMGGAGQYRYLVTNCASGALERDSREEYKDVGIEFEHQFRNRIGIGIRGGYVDDTVNFVEVGAPDGSNGSFSYINPYISYNHRWFGVGVGPFMASKDVLFLEDANGTASDRSSTAPAISLRLLRLDKFYLTGDLFTGVPVYSGGGYLSLGAGFRPVSRLGLWIGLSSSGPYDETGLLLQSETQVADRWFLGINGRYGQSGDIDEFGISAGVTYRVYR